MKQKLDRDGVNYLENEGEMGRKEGENNTPGKYKNTPRGIGPSGNQMEAPLPEYGRPVPKGAISRDGHPTTFAAKQQRAKMDSGMNQQLHEDTNPFA
jgi:hypothetical protein